MTLNVFVLLVPAVPLYLVAVKRRPQLTVLVALVCALLFELFAYDIGPNSGPFTANVPVFRSFGNGVVLLPIEVIIIVGLLVWLMKAALAGKLERPRSAFSKALCVFLFLCFVGFVIGLLPRWRLQHRAVGGPSVPAAGVPPTSSRSPW